MAGFWQGLFGKKEASNQPKDAFFLESDAAKSMGDLDYMRTPNRVRRTFPKTVTNPEHRELVREITATRQVTVVAMGGLPQATTPKAAPSPSFGTPATSSTAPSSTTSTTSSPRRAQDSGMDMFRNMAKDIKR
jgi:hypothetical protein